MRIEFCVRNDGVGTCEQVSPSAGDYTRAIRCAQGGDGVGVVSEYGRAPPLFFRNLGRCRKSLQCNGKRPVKPRLVSSGLRLSGALYSESSRWRKPSRSRTARDSVCTELGFRLHGAGIPFARSWANALWRRCTLQDDGTQGSRGHSPRFLSRSYKKRPPETSSAVLTATRGLRRA